MCRQLSFTTFSAGAFLSVICVEEDCDVIFLFLITATKPQSSLNHNLKSEPLVLTGDTPRLHRREMSVKQIIRGMICSAATPTMTRSHSRCPRGERLRMGLPHGHRKTTTLVAGLRMPGMVALMVLDGPINPVERLPWQAVEEGNWFEAYVIQVLVPELRP